MFWKFGMMFGSFLVRYMLSVCTIKDIRMNCGVRDAARPLQNKGFIEWLTLHSNPMPQFVLSNLKHDLNTAE